MRQCYLFKIDENETRRRVEECLESARVYKRFGFIRREATITASYEDTPRSYTGVTSNQTANISIYNVDQEKRMRTRYEQVMKAVSRLTGTQRKIIEERYLGEEDITDINVYVDLHLSERTYYYEKAKAIFRLAYALGLEVYEKST